MRKAIMRLVLGLLLILVLAPLLLSSCAGTAEKVSAQTLSGYIIDTHCYLKKPEPALDTKKCLQMEGCAATGFGIAVKQPDNAYKFYLFDGTFAPAASGAQTMAIDLINGTTKTDHVYITVVGTPTGKTIKAKEGAEFEVIKVTSIVESEDPG